MAISLNASNTYGFLKCKFGSEQSIKSVATNFFGKQMFKSVKKYFTLIYCKNCDNHHSNFILNSTKKMLQRATTIGTANVQTQ